MDEPITVRIAYYLLAIFIVVACVAFSKWRELSKERKLRELVSWSAIGDYCPALNRNSYVSEPFLTVWNAQYSKSIDKKHRITEVEKQYAIEVIEAYQKEIARSYFKGHLKLITSKYVVRGEDYFMLALYGFLSEHQCEYEFLGHYMHKDRTSYNQYGESLSSGWDATYALTEFSVVFHKMHYITYMYCRNSETLRCFVPEWNEKNLKEILDTKQIQISRA